MDLRGLLDTEEQKEFARIYISSFLEYSLKKNEQFLPLFRDHRVAGKWLPKTMYITRFQDQSFKPLATFEEDIDVTTGTAVGVHLEGSGLEVWKEQIMPLRSRNRATTSASQVNQSVRLGWNKDGSGDVSASPVSYSVSLPDTLGNSWDLTGEAHLQMALTMTRDEVASKGQNLENSIENTANVKEENREGTPIDVTVEITDALGRSAGLILSDYGAIRPPLQMNILRRRDMEEQTYEQNYELVLQTFSIPLSDFIELNPKLDLRKLSTIRLVFDPAIQGSVIVDDIGISFLDRAFTAEGVKDN